MRKKDLLSTQDIVQSVLKENPQTRNSDQLLYLKVVERINPLVLNQPFWYAMTSMKELGIPPFETVRRTRQKLQREFPTLRANEDAEAQRMLNECVYKEYALR